MRDLEKKITDKVKEYVHELSTPKIGVEVEVIERKTDTLITTFKFNIRDTRHLNEKKLKFGDIEALFYNVIKKECRTIVKEKNLFKSDYITCINVPGMLSGKICTRKVYNCSVELVTYLNEPFLFSYSTRNNSPQIKQLTQIIQDFLVILEIVMEEAEVIIGGK